jgi:DNA-binding NtrC family response regulator
LRVLVVDDDPAQLESLQRGLFLYGYETIGASDCQHATDWLLGPEGRSVQLLITDLTMPEPSGFELIENALQRWPQLSILVIAGLAMNSEILALRQRGIVILQKPFSPDQLDQMIRCLSHQTD